MIWGLALEPGHEYITRSEDEVHLSLATIESRAAFDKPGSYSQLVLKTDVTEQLLCTLVQGTIFQQCLDLKLMAGEKVTFTVQGTCSVYVTGYSFRSPLEPASDIGGQEETSMEINSMIYEDEPDLKAELGVDEGEIGLEGPVKEDCRMDTKRRVQAANEAREQALNDDRSLQEVQMDGVPQSSCDLQQNTPSATAEQAPLDVGKVKIEVIASSRVMLTPDEKEKSVPGPSRINAPVRNVAEVGLADLHLGENEGSQQRANTEPIPQRGGVHSTVTTDTSTRTNRGPAAPPTGNNAGIPAAPASGKVGGVSTNSEVGPVGDLPGPRPKGIEATNVLVPGSKSSPSLKPLSSPDDKYTCPLCSEVFPGKDSLLVHEQKHAQEGQMFSCRYCHMVFLQKGNRNIHERIHSAMRHNFRAAYKNQGDSKEKSRKASLDDVLQQSKVEPQKTPLVMQQSKVEPLVSPPQEKSRPAAHSQRKERVEIKSMLRSRPYPHYSGLGLRAQQPIEEKNYRCQYCEKPFKRNYDRNRHERIHTGQKPYECSFCDQAFSRREHCKKHEFTHLRSRPCDD